jgi:hypothetical protein
VKEIFTTWGAGDDARGIAKRQDHGRPAGGMHASGPPETPYKPLIIYPAAAG